MHGLKGFFWASLSLDWYLMKDHHPLIDYYTKYTEYRNCLTFCDMSGDVKPRISACSGLKYRCKRYTKVSLPRLGGHGIY